MKFDTECLNFKAEKESNSTQTHGLKSPPVLGLTVVFWKVHTSASGRMPQTQEKLTKSQNISYTQRHCEVYRGNGGLTGTILCHYQYATASLISGGVHSRGFTQLLFSKIYF